MVVIRKESSYSFDDSGFAESICKQLKRNIWWVIKKLQPLYFSGKSSIILLFTHEGKETHMWVKERFISNVRGKSFRHGYLNIVKKYKFLSIAHTQNFWHDITYDVAGVALGYIGRQS